MIMLDTHVWIYLISEDKGQISPKALEAIVDDHNLLISAMSCWEAALLIKRGRLNVAMEVGRWISNGLKYPNLKVIDVNPQILIKSVVIEGLHPDPADRIIAATCLLNNATLVTRDKRLHDWGGVRTIW